MSVVIQPMDIVTTQWNFLVDGMGRRVGWVAQGNELKVDPGLLKASDLLCDERLRQPRIAFEDNGNRHRLESG